MTCRPSGRPSGIRLGLDYRVIIRRLNAGEKITHLALEYGVNQGGLSKNCRLKGWPGIRSNKAKVSQ